MSHLVKVHLATFAARQWFIGGFDHQFGAFRELESVMAVRAGSTKTARQLCRHREAGGRVQVIQPGAQTASDGCIERRRRSLIVVAQRAQVGGRKD